MLLAVSCLRMSHPQIHGAGWNYVRGFIQSLSSVQPHRAGHHFIFPRIYQDDPLRHISEIILMPDPQTGCVRQIEMMPAGLIILCWITVAVSVSVRDENLFFFFPLQSWCYTTPSIFKHQVTDAKIN